ncbi:flagellar assembly peptidoglycan hydrolase FlgJ [Litchfieldella xinjiangensis]|uniref:flagellar assembly peptidoglycan hydrolase FlgJ n=1 Tax=Litchfieldella xinjiangensis TaxID=1166948 RepID=UPI00069487DF|nr:flagellar assembly peptidoglycan hydrolase FlgJ [Halomonas xinjiangensis]
MSVNNELSGQFALDMQGIQRLKHSASQDPNAGLPEAAKQFEAMFLQMMVKSMRDASPQSDLMNSQQTEFYTSLLDQQWSQHMAGKGVGLAEQLINQLEQRGLVPSKASTLSQYDELVAGIPRGTPRVLSDALIEDAKTTSSETASSADVTPTEQPPVSGFMNELGATSGSGFLDAIDAQRASQADATQANARPDASPATTISATQRSDVAGQPAHVEQFLTKLSGPAQAASRATGVPAELILAQAALETGWGRHEIPTAQGGNSHNLFGIKAGSQWKGATTDITTHEYVNGQRVRVTDTFRVYDSFEASFTDYARLIGDNPRYAKVTTASTPEHAARELQQAGYATDPAYATKLVAIMDTLGPLAEGDAALASNRVVERNMAFSRTPGSTF